MFRGYFKISTSASNKFEITIILQTYDKYKIEYYWWKHIKLLEGNLEKRNCSNTYKLATYPVTLLSVPWFLNQNSIVKRLWSN